MNNVITDTVLDHVLHNYSAVHVTVNIRRPSLLCIPSDNFGNA
jgi:hypothetical protein